MAVADERKRRNPEVFAEPCKACGSANTRVYSRGKYGRNGRQRYCKCNRCGATWSQTPRG